MSLQIHDIILNMHRISSSFVSVMSWFDSFNIACMDLSVVSSTLSWRRRFLREMDTVLSHRSQRMCSTQQSEGRERERVSEGERGREWIIFHRV